MAPERKTPRPMGVARGALDDDRWGKRIDREDSRPAGSPQSPGAGHADALSDLRRQRLAVHLHRCGPRPTFEALRAVAAGRPIDDVLAEFSRLTPELCRAVGADRMLPPVLDAVDGGRA